MTLLQNGFSQVKSVISLRPFFTTQLITELPTTPLTTRIQNNEPVASTLLALVMRHAQINCTPTHRFLSRVTSAQQC